MSVGLLKLEKTTLRRDLFTDYNFHVRGRGVADTDLFSVVPGDRSICCELAPGEV